MPAGARGARGAEPAAPEPCPERGGPGVDPPAALRGPYSRVTLFFSLTPRPASSPNRNFTDSLYSLSPRPVSLALWFYRDNAYVGVGAPLTEALRFGPGILRFLLFLLRRQVQKKIGVSHYRLNFLSVSGSSCPDFFSTRGFSGQQHAVVPASCCSPGGVRLRDRGPSSLGTRRDLADLVLFADCLCCGRFGHVDLSEPRREGEDPRGGRRAAFVFG